MRGLVLRDNTVEPHGDRNIPKIDAMEITYGARATERGVFTTHQVIEVDLGTRNGLIESYTCRGCGFIELYARDPAAIPIGEAYGTELFEVPAVPYRT